MKTTYRHLIKIISCSLAITAVLLCSVFVPVKALSVLKPKDYIHSISLDGNIEKVVYSFDIEPFFSVKNESTGTTTNGIGNVTISPSVSDKPVIFRYYPLGSSFAPGNKNNGSVIDVSDFKKRSVFEFSGSIDFNIDYIVNNTTSETSSFYFLTSTYICFYDADGNFISQIFSGSERADFTIDIISVDPIQSYASVLNYNFDIQVPDGAVYMAPCVLAYLYPPSPDAAHYFTSVRTSCHYFILQVNKNLVIEQTETMEAIEDQLGDLNDKADEIISGSDHMNDTADDFSSIAGDAEQEMNNAIDQLDQLPDVDIGDVDLSFDGLLTDKGFSQYSSFFLALSNDSFWVSIMIFVCTFIWVSTLLFGKRG